jgi:hypothetical protein
MKKIIFLLFVVILTASCNETSNNQSNDLNVAELINPVYYDNGVYYFDCSDKKFAESLSRFIEKSVVDSLEIKSVVGNGSGLYGKDNGYFVIVGKK